MKRDLFLHMVFVLYSYNPAHSMRDEPYEGEIEAVKCPVNWSYNFYERKCIRFFTSDGMSEWNNADQFCKKQGADIDILAIINKKSVKFSQESAPPNIEFWLESNAMATQLINRPKPLYNAKPMVTAHPQTYCPLVRRGSLIWEDCTYNATIACQIADVDPCEIGNGGCSHRCYVDGFKRRTCACNPGFHLFAGIRCVEKSTCLVNNGGCDHECVTENDRPVCNCEDGYRLTNEKQCQDINECHIKNGGCEQECTNTPGSWLCSCGKRFTPQGLWCRYNGPGSQARKTDQLVSALPRTVMVISGFLTIAIVMVGCFLTVIEYEAVSELKASQERLTAQRKKFDDSDAWDKEVNYDETETLELSTDDEDNYEHVYVESHV